MSKVKFPSAPFRFVRFGAVDIRQTIRADGSILLRSAIPLEAHPVRMTERLLHWATATPDRIFMGERNQQGEWITITYSQTLSRVQCIAQALLNRNLSPERPILILSENSIEHGLLALAALHVGLPYSPITPAYSLRSPDFRKLKQVLDLLTPGLILVSDGIKYEAAVKAAAAGIEIVSIRNPSSSMKLFDELTTTLATPAVEEAYDTVGESTVAKILFTSGSTGIQKGVINTHGNISANWQQITQTLPFLQDDALELMDWLPWSHTYGGNHNFGLALYHGGSLYIDEGNPTSAGMTATVANLRVRQPTVYFNVPRGFEELIPFLQQDKALRENFFSKLKLLFYAGASMPQHVWDALEELAIETGQKSSDCCGVRMYRSKPGNTTHLHG